MEHLNVNYLYFTVSIIILIFVFHMLNKTQKYIHEKKIAIEAKKNTFLIPQNLCEMYLYNIKKNLLQLYKTINFNKCEKIKTYVKQTNDELRNFSGYTKAATDEDLIRYDLVSKLDLLSDNDFELHRSFADVILNIEVLMNMLRTSSCQDKRLTIISLQNLLVALQETQCKEDFIHDNKILSVSRRSGSDELMTNKTNQSQNIMYDINGEEYTNQEETIVYKYGKPQNEKILKKDLVSQEFECSSDYIMTQKSSQPYTPLCDINHIRKERNKLRALTTDMNFNRSLRKDYDYLDE